MSSGLCPAIAIEQNKSIGSSRSSVWTITEIDDYVRLLFAKLGDMYSYASGEKIEAQTIDTIMSTIKKDYVDEKVYLLQQVRDFDNKEYFDDFVKKNRSKVERGKWFTRYLLFSTGGSSEDVSDNHSFLDPTEFFYLETPTINVKYFPLSVYWIYDRVTIEDKRMARLKEDVIKILTEVPKFGIYVEGVKKKWLWSDAYITWFTDKNYDAAHDIQYPDFTPQHFSPNRQEWACDHCHGLGEVLQVDMQRVLDVNSAYLNAVLPWRDSKLWQAILKKLAHRHDIDVDMRWTDMPEWFQHIVINGDEELLRIPMGDGKYVSMYYKGIEDILRDQYHKWVLTVDFQAMLEMKQCPACMGARLKKESLHVMVSLPRKDARSYRKAVTKAVTTIDWAVLDVSDVMFSLQDRWLFNIHDIHQLSIHDLVWFFSTFKSTTTKAQVLVDRILNPLLDRLQTIDSLGLGYLNLHRGVKTLSGGEVQRLRLAKQLWNKLTGILYVLDEPTIGLDDAEIQRMILAIRQLQQMGNSIVVVEHHAAFIAACDWVIEVWPWAGDFGGRITFEGSIDNFLASTALTADYLTGRKTVDVDFEHNPQQTMVSIKKASKYNLQGIDVSIPLGGFTIITWSSGAGKTTLMYTTLYRFLHEREKFVQSYIRLELLKKGMSRQEIISAPVMKREEYQHFANVATQYFFKDLAVETILWYEHIDNIVYVDQSSIGKTPRSCPATFIGVFDDIRQLFAGVADAKYLWFNAGHFSFNSWQWACPECKWYGYKKIELQFLPDTYVPCDMCHGRRYKPEVLEIKRRDHTIGQVLDMYIKDALVFFEEMSHIHEQLTLLCEIGLGYLTMGQPAHTLSWWESQRLKLVKHLIKSFKWHTMYFLDEPTVGLHPVDIERLLKVLKRFLNNWDSVIMIEHDQDLLRFADKVIRLHDGKLVE